MTDNQAVYDALLDRFVNWARTCRDIRAAAIIGSRARTDHPADEWSDVDIVLVVTDPNQYLSTADWLQHIGNPWLTCVARVEGRTFRAAWFEGEAKLDFVIVPSRSMRAAAAVLRIGTRFPRVFRLLPEQLSHQLAAFSETIAKGMRVLIDKDGWVAPLAEAGVQGPSLLPPAAAEFTNVVNTFWSWSLWTAKILRRGELWRAKHACDHEMKEMVLQMLEWHARAECGWAGCTWYLGRFLEQWADPRAVAALRDAFAHYDEEDIGRALFATMTLYAWLARETAARLRLPYPAAEEERIMELAASHCTHRQALR